MTFNEIIKANPAAGELAMELVCKALGIQWHRFVRIDEGTNHNCDGLPYAYMCACGKPFHCNVKLDSGIPIDLGSHIREANPALLTSLDAWRPLLKEMGGYGLLYVEKLMEIVDPSVRRNEHGMYELITGELYLLMIAQPHHHLEAALRTLEGECPECEGEGEKVINVICDNCGFVQDEPTRGICCAEMFIVSNRLQPCTCTNGKRTLYEIWEREVSE